MLWCLECPVQARDLVATLYMTGKESTLELVRSGSRQTVRFEKDDYLLYRVGSTPDTLRFVWG